MAATKVASTFRVPSAAEVVVSLRETKFLSRSETATFTARLKLRWYFSAFTSAIVCALLAARAAAQPFVFQPGLETPSMELSGVVQVDQADHAALSLLEVAKAHIAERQWTEAIDKLLQAEESAGRKLFKLDKHRYVPLQEYCQSLVARLPDEGLSVYRERVDSLAKTWYENGLAARDAALLQKVVDQYFSGSYGDEALLALGEIAIERGEPQRAFAYWERISHKLRPAGGLPLWLAYPDTNLNLADVRARLVLACVLAGDLRWARIELKALNQYHPGAKGKLGGREVVYTEALAEMIEAAKSWPQTLTGSAIWPTFAGSPARQHVAHGELSVKELIGDFSVPVQYKAAIAIAETPPGVNFGGDQIRQLKNYVPVLSYYSVVAGGLLLFSSTDEIFAYHATTGRPAWQGDSQKPGRIFWGGKDNSPKPARVEGRDLTPSGAARFTLTVSDHWLLARMGSSVTARASEFERRRQPDDSYVVCLDLAAEGRLNWKLTPDDAGWAFGGSPVCDGANVYVAMRFSDGTGMPQEHVACFDLKSGTRRWRQLVCAAQSPSLGIEDVSHNLLTLAGDRLYLSTNLGAVAAIDMADGHVCWLTTYPRTKQIDVIQRADQDVNPAIYDRGILFAAPTDFTGILAFNAFTGQLQWDSDVPTDVTGLLGVSGGNLWASGKTLWALDARSGKVEYHSAASADANDRSIVNHGRGLLAADKVYWPVRIDNDDGKTKPEYQIRVFDAQTAKESRPIRLGELKTSCESGNLLMTDQNLVIASPDRVTLFALPRKSDSTNSSD